MLEKQANSLTFLAQFIASKVGATGLTVTVDVWEIQQDGTAAEIVTAGSATEIGDGLYRYILASGSVDANAEYICVFKTADSSVDQQHLAAVYSVGRAGVANLDAAISSRSTITTAQVNTEVDTALADYDGPTHAELVSEVNSVQVDIAALNDLSATEVEDAVWDAVLANHQDAGSTGEALDAAGAAGATPAAIADAVWDEVLAGHLTAGSTGEALDDASSPGGTIFPSGAIDFTYTVTDSVSGLPIEGVEVWISTDNPAVNIVWKGDTDAFGVARDVNSNLPALDAGVYYFWRQKAGYIFVDPDTETVS